MRSCTEADSRRAQSLLLECYSLKKSWSPDLGTELQLESDRDVDAMLGLQKTLYSNARGPVADAVRRGV